MLCIYIIIKRHGIIILYLFYGLWMQICWYPFPSTIGLLSYPIQNDSHEMQNSFEPTINRITFCIQKIIQSLNQEDMAEQVLRSIDLAAMKLIGNSVDPFASGKLDVSRVITLAERSHQQLQLSVPHMIRLALEH